jgi:aspartate/tyrosine/aromatic aminotransferase
VLIVYCVPVPAVFFCNVIVCVSRESIAVFESLEMAPPDAIMGLTEAFKKDPNPNKINLTIGIYKDDTGNTPIFGAVKKAETALLDAETTKSYLSIEGAADYARCVQDMVFGADHAILAEHRAVTAHTPGGTGALRVAADFLKTIRPDTTIWLSDPTWPNHPGIFKAAGLNVKFYPYYDAENHSLDFDALIGGLKQIPKGDVVVLHGCCHNPTGMDPDAQQWAEIARVAGEQGFTVFFDFAYQGLANGLEEDAQGLRLFCGAGCELLVASSFSKNFGLYRERTGALTLVGGTADAAQAALSHLKRGIRANYSNPPAHGAAIVVHVLSDPALRTEWEAEVQVMCDRINGMREKLVAGLKTAGIDRDFSFLTKQNGMFSFSGLTKEQVERLRTEYAIYIVGSGRINVAALTDKDVKPLSEAIKTVLS